MKGVKKYCYMVAARLFLLFFYYFDNSFIHSIVILIFTCSTKSLGRNWIQWGLWKCKFWHLDVRQRCKQMGYRTKDGNPTYWMVLLIREMERPWQCEKCACCEPTRMICNRWSFSFLSYYLHRKLGLCVLFQIWMITCTQRVLRKKGSRLRSSLI